MQELLLMGGEPLVIKEIRKLMEDFPSDRFSDLQFSIITNGTIFDEKTIRLIRKSRLSWVLISIDAAKPETYAHIRKHGDLAKTIEGVRTWKHLSDECGFDLVLSYTAMRDNIKEMAEFIELSRQHGVDCQFSLVSGTKADQHLIDYETLDLEIDRSLAVLAALKADETMPLARSSLIALKDARWM
jgi:MoaA/NifB/PqqE/SkfB family radical SAM enzyme